MNVLFLHSKSGGSRVSTTPRTKTCPLGHQALRPGHPRLPVDWDNRFLREERQRRKQIPCGDDRQKEVTAKMGVKDDGDRERC